ncbi:hypothetical protein L7F22_047337 [Adiantum nelumboides]|nr:hypothetical protein [Adiantum nelumboides]
MIVGERVSSDIEPANSQDSKHEPMTIKPIVKEPKIADMTLVDLTKAIQEILRLILAHKDVEAYDVPDLPSRVRTLFRTKFKTLTSSVHTRYDSSDGRTTKLLITFQVGVIPKIIALKVDLPDVSLAISLHAPTQELRAEIVPAARAFPLFKLIAAVDSYLVERCSLSPLVYAFFLFEILFSRVACNEQEGTLFEAVLGRRMMVKVYGFIKSKVFIEYVMLAAVNDGEVQAHQMGKLLHGRKVVVNLIPYNPTTVTTWFEASGSTEVHKFQKILKEVYGLRSTVRQEMGQDIEGACGQLHVSHLSNNSSKANPAVRDIEDFGHVK